VVILKMTPCRTMSKIKLKKFEVKTPNSMSKKTLF
jgi:hypothetical protein